MWTCCWLSLIREWQLNCLNQNYVEFYGLASDICYIRRTSVVSSDGKNCCFSSNKLYVPRINRSQANDSQGVPAPTIVYIYLPINIYQTIWCLRKNSINTSIDCLSKLQLKMPLIDIQLRSICHVEAGYAHAPLSRAPRIPVLNVRCEWLYELLSSSQSHPFTDCIERNIEMNRYCY